MKALVLALIVALSAVAPGALNTSMVAHVAIPIVQTQQSALDVQLHEMYEGAWARATLYTDVKPEEMPKFPEEDVYWLMTKELRPIDQNVHMGPWHTDIFKTGISRVLAWYKTDAGIRIEKGISLPVNARIEMLVTQVEIDQYTHHIEGILAHEMIHYIHHMRVMNLKGWEKIWPGDGHNYMAFLKYVKGYDFPANQY